MLTASISVTAKESFNPIAMNTKENKKVSAGSIAFMTLVGLVLLVAISNATYEPTEKEKLEAGFSIWDGSHIEFTNYLKEQLRDPDSYEHIETRYGKKGSDSVRIQTTFRAKNGFGGFNIMRAEGIAHVDGKFGRLLSIETE